MIEPVHHAKLIAISKTKGQINFFGIKFDRLRGNRSLNKGFFKQLTYGGMN